ncbi:MAG: NAD-dependent epimerase/dehydratase family protein, partial [Chitinophagaceae bacterium]
FLYFEKPDALIHLAWEGLPHYKEFFHVEQNMPRHFSFLENLVRNGCRDITIAGTCLEYGMQEGCLDEDLPVDPQVAYPRAKNMLRLQLEELRNQYDFNLKWVRLFYMFGKGQSPNSIISQLEKALLNGDKVFNMSPGDQKRDYLPIETVATYICDISQQTAVEGIINCCSGVPIEVKQLVEDYLTKTKQSIILNTGFYPYADIEPFAFWGNNKKLKRIIQ